MLSFRIKFREFHLLGYTYERLDGSVRGEERYLAVNNFNESDSTFVFLLSTRAGKLMIIIIMNL